MRTLSIWKLLALTFAFEFCLCYSSKTFRAAVYEHAGIPPNTRIVVSRSEALQNMMGSLKTYKIIAEEAHRQNVDIIVFPEDGLTYYGHTRLTAKPYLEYVPDPRRERWNPCLEPKRYQNTDVQNMLSCLARNNSLHLVANMGDIQPCNITSDKLCPPDGHYQFNTDVVFDEKGFLIARYHKINLFFEYMYDPSPTKEIVFFDTKFGRFGVFTCFDILFKQPVIDLMDNQGIRNVVFPTAWMDTQPYFAAIQFHSAFAVGFGINFIAANLHHPKYRFQGSGIYSPNGAKTFYYNSSETSGGKLLIADLDILQVNSPSKHNSKTTSLGHFGTTTKDVFKALVFGDEFNFVALDTQVDQKTVCHTNLCCHLNYRTKGPVRELFALGAFDGLHTKEGTYYIQLCALLKCKNESRLSCGEGSNTSMTHFSELHLQGNFSTRYVFPEILLYGNNSLQLPPNNSDWNYRNATLEATHGFRLPLLTYTLFSRNYNFDPSHNKTDRPQITSLLG